MADGGSLPALRYSAFISYSHLDAAFARRLQSRLENYRLPRRLARQATWREGRARRLRPVFRDRSELAAADDLTQAVKAAIAESSHLVVVCSANSAAAEWVAREVEFFHCCHGPSGVLAVLIDGASAAGFPPALQCVGADGLAHQPLAADFGRAGDGDRLALLKLVAALAGVRLDELVQRDAQRRVRQASIAGAAGLAGMAVMAVLTVAALRARATAERGQAGAEQMIGHLANDLRGKLKAIGGLSLLDAVNKSVLAYYQEQDLSQLPPRLLEQRAEALQDEGQDEEKRGHFDVALKAFDEAKRTTGTLLADKPSDEDRIFADAQSEYWLGFIFWRLGQYDTSHVHYLAYESLAKRLRALSPGKIEWVEEYADAEISLGQFALRHSYDLRSAEDYLEKSRVAYLKVIQSDRKGMAAQDGLLNNYGYRADLQRLKGKYDDAERIRQDQRRYLEKESGEDDRDFDVQAMQVAITVALARIDMCRHGWAKAFENLSGAENKAKRLAAIDNSNTDEARQVLGIRLLEMEAWMKLPATDRAAHTETPSVLEDCKTDQVVKHSTELQALCSIVKIGYFELVGPRSEAKNELTRLKASGLLRDDTLTERWGLNMRWELSTIIGYREEGE